MKTSLNLQSAGKILSTLDKRLANLPEQVQDLIVFGAIHYGAHGDTGFLTRVVRVLSGHKGTVKSEKVKAYIEYHIPSVSWDKQSDGQMGYVKSNANESIEMVERWDTFKAEGKAVKSDLEQLAELVDRLEKKGAKSELLAGAAAVLATYYNDTIETLEEIAALENAVMEEAA